MQVLTASVPKEVSHLTTLMSMGGGLRSAADAHELRAACS
jgi:Xaa-Pro aminopeptidase